MKLTINKNPEEKRGSIMCELIAAEKSLEELENSKMAKWRDVKDFIDGNSVGKMETFIKWEKNVYRKDKKSLSTQITKLKNQLEDL